jgi:hypothetical protein
MQDMEKEATEAMNHQMPPSFNGADVHFGDPSADGSDGPMLKESESASASTSMEMTDDLAAKMLQQLRLSILMVAKVAPEVAEAIGEDRLMALTQKKPSFKGLEKVMRAIDKLDGKLKSEAKKDLKYISATRKECYSNKRRFWKQLKTAVYNIRRRDTAIKASKVSIRRARYRLRRSERLEAKLDGSKVRVVRERNELEDGYFARKFQRDRQRNVLRKAINLTCKFRSQRKQAYCVNLNARPNPDVPEGCWIRAPKGCKNNPKFYKLFRDEEGEEKAGAGLTELACLVRAKHYFQKCGNAKTQPISAEYRLTGVKFEYPTQSYKEYKDMHVEDMKQKDEAFEAKKLATDEKKRVEEDKQMQMKQESAEFDKKEGPEKATLALIGESDEAKTEQKVLDELKVELHMILEEDELPFNVQTQVKEALLLATQGHAMSMTGTPLVVIIANLRDNVLTEQINDDNEWAKALRLYRKRIGELDKAMASESRRQKKLNTHISRENNRISADVAALVRYFREFNSAKSNFVMERARCKKENVLYSVRFQVNSEEQLNIVRLISLLRSFNGKKVPRCPNMCTAPENGTCVWTTKFGSETVCACERGFYGKACSLKRCPGEGRNEDGEPNIYGANEDGVCSGRGSCDTDKGVCKCRQGYYHSINEACEFKVCPGGGNCSGNGMCDKLTGECRCKTAWHGRACNYLKCPNSNGLKYPGTSQSACNGHGACSATTGRCSCGFPYFGSSCQYRRCPYDCNGRGTCSRETGQCACKKPFVGRSCAYRTCPEDCGGPSQGVCDRTTGKCSCKKGASGPFCRKSSSCDETRADWFLSFDKKGWSTCPPGFLMRGLIRNKKTCDAIYCLEGAMCGRPCEGTRKADLRLNLSNCYHHNWHKTFDLRGWSKCFSGYFLAGLYRGEKDSLYSIGLGLCCSVERATWSTCTSANWFSSFKKVGTSWAKNHTFMTGLFRGRCHNLSCIEMASVCTFSRTPRK